MLTRMMGIVLLVLASSTTPVAVTMAGPSTTLNGNDPGSQRRLGSQAEIDTWNSIRSREMFQMEQRRQRAEDREMNQRREPLPHVPQFRPGCLNQGQNCR